ncbi:von Willebrand factor type A domain-containing protein [Cytophagaceae bacterium DM2B3-1]|uniref:von Willebrand factor type A domain-containing protein n=1 Tax=Xanthocytophaga flava TaxID=3048013 RepID=A0ABT7CMU7_9BACT|nr:von Willebrand factor type A domain-containing protein [Xanthocytophaga flavus]MDJ1495061.1 von Willebrand factor type A domain-containing protein [Xanthocytophaga flavus]
MSKLLIVPTLFCLSWLGFALIHTHKTITGTVTDSVTHQKLAGVKITVQGTATETKTDGQGNYSIQVAGNLSVLVFTYSGYAPKNIPINNLSRIDVKLVRGQRKVVVASKDKAYQPKNETKQEDLTLNKTSIITQEAETSEDMYFMEPNMARSVASPVMTQDYNTESYSTIHENIFHEALRNPLSTFSIDVDAASYSNIRRFVDLGQAPPKDAVRIEEMINYFEYDYPQPTGNVPFSITTEVSECPWNPKNQLVHIGLQGKNIPTQNLPPSNLVFLIDVSGSMQDANKLPLLKSAFGLLIEQLRPQDHVAIVVYAGAAGLVLPSTSGNQKEKIRNALNQLEAGGSTAGGQGIELAYKVAQEYFQKEGNNRIILATDGDFNVGASSDAEMERLIEQKRSTGIFLTVLGFGMGNYKDSKMEILADKGDGNYAYIDNLLEGKKVFVNEFGGTLFTIAKDVKIQIEFNPVLVKAYRLVGYENRALKNEDFNNDKKDAGELGSGHNVTALYEIVPTGESSDNSSGTIDPLKYQKNVVDPKAYKAREMMTVKLRYKKPNETTSSLIEKTLDDHKTPLSKTSDNFRFSAAVAEYAMLLCESEYKGNATYNQVITLATQAKGKDEEGYRIEFINMVKASEFLQAKR